MVKMAKTRRNRRRQRGGNNNQPSMMSYILPELAKHEASRITMEIKLKQLESNLENIRHKTGIKSARNSESRKSTNNIEEMPKKIGIHDNTRH
jgi:hypothetical protein